MKRIYIFDLDGTLALIDHRRPILDDEFNPNRWDDFFKECPHDRPNWPVIKLLKMIRNEHHDIIIFSGRSDLVEKETYEWLRKYTGIHPDEFYKIKMRKQGDYTPDEELKRDWFEDLSACEQAKVECVFDDRDKVVEMWRSIGLSCFQVAPGDF